MQPIVLLERLEKNDSPEDTLSNTNSDDEGIAPNYSDMLVESNEGDWMDTVPEEKENVEQQKPASSSENNNTMRVLRKRPLANELQKGKKKSSVLAKRRTEEKNNMSSTDDENKPLKYFAKKKIVDGTADTSKSPAVGVVTRSRFKNQPSVIRNTRTAIIKNINKKKVSFGGEDIQSSQEMSPPLNEETVPTSISDQSTENKTLSPIVKRSKTAPHVPKVVKELIVNSNIVCLPPEVKNATVGEPQHSNNVYDFIDENETERETSGFENYRQKQRCLTQESPILLDDGENENLYLDVLPNRTHIVKITQEKVPNQDKVILKASLIAKDTVPPIEETYVQRKGLLDQLLNVSGINTQQIQIANVDNTNADIISEAESQNNSCEGHSLENSHAVQNDKIITEKTDNVTNKNESSQSSENTTLDVNESVIIPQTSTLNVPNVRTKTKSSLRNKNVLKKVTSTIRVSCDREEDESDSSSCFDTQSGSMGKTVRSNLAFRRSLFSISNLKPDKKKTGGEDFPECTDPAKLVNAPIFYPTEAQFSDPMKYFEEIMPQASKFGLCKVVAPKNFKPKCILSDDIKFTVMNQYISRLYNRWGPASREMSAIKAYLASQSVVFKRAPLVEGMEVNLPKLYHVVQRHGGLKNVIEKKRWSRVAEDMRFVSGHNPEKKLDQLYVKYLLPYDTLSHMERQHMMVAVESCWNKKNQRMLKRALNPLHRQKQMTGESESSEEDTEDEDHVVEALSEAEDCVVTGRKMTLATFKKVAASSLQSLFPDSPSPTSEEVEEEYWRVVLHGADHVCVNSASIDTGDEGYGFPKSSVDPYGTHPWNLKMVTQNKLNALQMLGPVLGVTVPTVHLGMVFSTSCWHRDPHGLPWIEYMHNGPGKIWYGIPKEQSGNFRTAVETLCPTFCQNKSIWLASDITVIPPNLLNQHSVSLSKVVQKPGEYIIVFPKAYSCSISTGYTESESVYLAPSSWLDTVEEVFQEVRESCEPTMFSLEQLLLASVQKNPNLRGLLKKVLQNELILREELRRRGMQVRHQPQKHTGSWNVREQPECELCRATLYLSMVIGFTNKRSSLCPSHALRVVDATKNSDLKAEELELVEFYTSEELQNKVESLFNPPND